MGQAGACWDAPFPTLDTECYMARELLHKVHALCPHCLETLPAEVYADGEGKVWMDRTCPEHGESVTYVWPD